MTVKMDRDTWDNMCTISVGYHGGFVNVAM